MKRTSRLLLGFVAAGAVAATLFAFTTMPSLKSSSSVAGNVDAFTAPTEVNPTNNPNLNQNTMKTIYDFTVLGKKGEEVALKEYEGKVLLVVNTASRCGFTPQYEALEAMYDRLKDRGLEILDFPCNQFGNQAPESDEELTQFCSLTYGTKFPQFKKIEVNGENEIPLYTWLKEQKGFEGFDEGDKLAGLLDKMMREADPDYDKKPSIKWNFTKFLINRKGEVVARFEPTHDMADVEKQVETLL